MVLWAEEHGRGQPLILLPWFGSITRYGRACEPALAGSLARIYLDCLARASRRPSRRTRTPWPTREQAVSELPAPVRSPWRLFVRRVPGGELARRDPARFAAIPADLLGSPDHAR